MSSLRFASACAALCALLGLQTPAISGDCCRPCSCNAPSCLDCLKCCRIKRCCIAVAPPAAPRAVVMQAVPAQLVATHALAVDSSVMSNALMIQLRQGQASSTGDTDLQQLRRDVDALSATTKQLAEVVKKLDEKLDKKADK